MAVYTQIAKQRIDTGKVGNANSGDIIYDGGKKLNENLDALYNTFGDLRLFNIEQGVGNQLLHATGYFQKHGVEYYTNNVIQVGSRHDLNTTAGSFKLTLPTPKLGEMVEFINSNGSFKKTPVIIKAGSGSSIDGNNEVTITNPYSFIQFICIDDTPSAAKWMYRISQLFGDYSVPIDTIEEVDNLGSKKIELFNKELYSGVKLIISAEEIKSGVKEMTMSEVLLMVDAEDDKIYSDEYAVIYKNNKIYNIDFSVENDICVATVSTTLSRMMISIKSIETIRASI